MDPKNTPADELKMPDDLDAYLEEFNAGLLLAESESATEASPETVTESTDEEKPVAAPVAPESEQESRRARALKKLGYTDDDIDSILADESPTPQTTDTEEAFEAMLASDLALIRERYPDTAPASLHDLADLSEYVRQRAYGKDPVAVFESLVKVSPPTPPVDNKAHLIPSAPAARRAAPPGEMPADVYRAMEALYPGATKQELQKLYTRVTRS